MLAKLNITHGPPTGSPSHAKEEVVINGGSSYSALELRAASSSGTIGHRGASMRRCAASMVGPASRRASRALPQPAAAAARASSTCTTSTSSPTGEKHQGVAAGRLHRGRFGRRQRTPARFDAQRLRKSVVGSADRYRRRSPSARTRATRGKRAAISARPRTGRRRNLPAAAPMRRALGRACRAFSAVRAILPDSAGSSRRRGGRARGRRRHEQQGRGHARPSHPGSRHGATGGGCRAEPFSKAAPRRCSGQASQAATGMAMQAAGARLGPMGAPVAGIANVAGSAMSVRHAGRHQDGHCHGRHQSRACGSHSRLRGLRCGTACISNNKTSQATGKTGQWRKDRNNNHLEREPQTAVAPLNTIVKEDVGSQCQPRRWTTGCARFSGGYVTLERADDGRWAAFRSSATSWRWWMCSWTSSTSSRKRPRTAYEAFLVWVSLGDQPAWA